MIENYIMRLSLTDEEVVANMHGIGQFEGNMNLLAINLGERQGQD